MDKYLQSILKYYQEKYRDTKRVAECFNWYDVQFKTQRYQRFQRIKWLYEESLYEYCDSPREMVAKISVAQDRAFKMEAEAYQMDWYDLIFQTRRRRALVEYEEDWCQRRNPLYDM